MHVVEAIKACGWCKNGHVVVASKGMWLGQAMACGLCKQGHVVGAIKACGWGNKGMWLV